MWLFFFNDTATTEIYTLSLHDALPISPEQVLRRPVVVVDQPADLPHDLRRLAGDPELGGPRRGRVDVAVEDADRLDRKSTRLNSSHANISYAVFCLKKKLPPHGPPMLG